MIKIFISKGLITENFSFLLKFEIITTSLKILSHPSLRVIASKHTQKSRARCDFHGADDRQMKCSGPLPFLANWLNCHITFRGLRFFVTDRLFTGPRLVIRKTLCTPLPLFVSMQLTKRTASHHSHPHRLTLAVSTSLSPRKQLVNTLTTPFSSASTFCLFPVQWQLLNSRVNGGPSIHRRWRLTG